MALNCECSVGLSLSPGRGVGSLLFTTIKKLRAVLGVCSASYSTYREGSLSEIKGGDSSVGIALGYGLDDRGSRVRFPAAAGNFSLHHRVQYGSGAHPASYPVGTRGSFPGGNAAGA
jgi:hypothetical protein